MAYKLMEKLMEHDEVIEVRTYMCMFNLRHLHNRLPIKKDTWLLVTSPEMAAEVQRACDGKHDHKPWGVDRVTG